MIFNAIRIGFSFFIPYVLEEIIFGIFFELYFYEIILS